MEGVSEGEKKQPPEGDNRTKRKMKTASQLEILEKAYAVDAYPSEALRAELSEKLGLSDRQLQMWFCHRRLKDRKATLTAAKKPLPNDSPPAAALVPVGEDVEQLAVANVRPDRVLASELRPFDLLPVVPRPRIAFPRMGAGLPALESNSYYESHQAIEELRAIAFVERQLGEPLREDGPFLGIEFDSLPPGAFGAPIGAMTMGQHTQSGRPFEAKIYEQPDKGVSRTLHEYKFIPEQPTVRNETYERVAPSIHYSFLDGVPHSRNLSSSGRSFFTGNESAPYRGQIHGLNLLSQQGRQNNLLPSASGENNLPQKNPFVDVIVNNHSGTHPITLIDSLLMPSDRKVIHEEELSRFQRKRKSEEARMQRELEAQEKSIRKEREKEDILRRKREEQIKKEMEKHDRERQKEAERLLRERQREEERYQREQRRELERREKFLRKESIRAEKLRQKEEIRREKEAARVRAANERAFARRMARESMELIEDEQLELMELATSKKGLSSILALDNETMQNLELYADGRISFPPKSVHLKRPFSIQPWSDSEESVGNLLMVWRFLVTFADVLGIWPFTLDELIQAFHDYDPRLLGEIHIALLRSIIKDIEDVVRTPTGLGANQNSSANPSGGHPQVVEGAYVWGFDIRNWQRHLNPLTWPEILRQFALSAGFGPQLKKQNIEQVHASINNEGNDGKDIISNLRSGAAAKNAIAIMQEKGFSNPRKSRHCLTPGTVKFAAFHVLSVEGSNGLNILEVADKIQKSGLRDLRTSKTPEASIAAALSRDTKLFERTAPSTYCVRPPYRKDPDDSEAIFSAARERIRVFKSGFVDTKEVDDGERDEESESDMAEDPGVDDLGAETTNVKQEGPNSEEFNATTVMRNRKDAGKVLQIPDAFHQKVDEGLASIVGFNVHKDVSASGEIAVCCNDAANPNLEGIDFDDSIPGEPWVQGLMEGEYSDLSVEERLNALVALIGVAIEGSSLRAVLEERLEAANALKKQMWAEAQLDKRRIKEDNFVKMQTVSYSSNRNKPAVAFPPVEGKQIPLVTVDVKNDKAMVTHHCEHEQINGLQENQNDLPSSPLEVNMQMQDCSAGLDNYYFQQSGYAAENSRSNLKSYIGHLAEQTYMYRSLPLGLDRRRNRYWQFIMSASQSDPGCGRIFVEFHDGCWRLIDSEEGFDALLASLDVRGIRESYLHMMLQRIEMSFKESVRRNVLNGNTRMQNGDSVKRLKSEGLEIATNQDSSVNIHCPTSVCIENSDALGTSTSFVVQLGRNEADSKVAFMRYLDFEKWMQKECLHSSILCAMKFGKKRCNQLLAMCDLCHDVYFSGGIPCPSCHMAHSGGKLKIHSDYFHVSSSSPLRMRMLKVLLSIVEVFLPHEALQLLWTDSYRKSWSTKLHATSSTEDLLQVIGCLDRILTVLEDALKREYLASNYETTRELLGSFRSSGCSANDSIGDGRIPVLPWVPYTTAAVALRLMELDACIFYTLEQKLESEKDKRIGIVMKLPSKYASAKVSYNAGATETSHQVRHTVDNRVDFDAYLASSSRGQRTRQDHGHSRGGRSQGRVVSSRSDSRKSSTTSSSRKLGRLLGWKGKPCAQGPHFRGRRSIRSRQKPAAEVDVISGERDNQTDITEEVPCTFVREEINGGEMEPTARNASSSERSGYKDDIYQATGNEYDYLVNNNYGCQGCFSVRPENFVGGNYGVDDEEIENIVVDDDDEDGQADLDVEDYIIGDPDTGDNREENAELNMDPDIVVSISSDDSD